MNFYSHSFLIDHCQDILAFYDERIIDKNGGYFQNFLDDGRVINPGFKQLVSSTRIVVNYANAARILNKPEYLAIAGHGLKFIEQVHWQAESQLYAWTLQDNEPLDLTQQAYGYAFVLLAYAAARKANLVQSNEKLLYLYQLLEERFWLPEHGLYADTMSSDGVIDSYRGQNANMHLCEAMIAAYEATKEQCFLKRAETIAENICVRQAKLGGGLVWEHFDTEFNIDWEYNLDDPKNLYRPWGFQPGHQTEWTKLLLTLNQYSELSWLLDKAAFLFDNAFECAWDSEHGGLIYGFDPKGEWCDEDKYFWVQAESFAAAALLYQATEDESYLNKYQMLWQYSWEHMIDHEYGAWFRVLTRDNQKYSNEKSSAGAKCDYHTLGACFDVLTKL